VETVDTNQAGAVDTKCRLEVGRFMEVVLEAFTKCVTVRSNEVRLHLRLADHAVPDRYQKRRNSIQR